MLRLPPDLEACRDTADKVWHPRSQSLRRVNPRSFLGRWTSRQTRAFLRWHRFHGTRSRTPDLDRRRRLRRPALGVVARQWGYWWGSGQGRHKPRPCSRPSPQASAALRRWGCGQARALSHPLSTVSKRQTCIQKGVARCSKSKRHHMFTRQHVDR